MEKAESNLQIVGKYRLREASSFIFRNKLTFACLSFFLSFYLIQFQSSWPGLRISGVRGYRDFIDQQSILDSADCFKKYGMDIYKVSSTDNPCDGFQYSVSLLQLINFTHISNLGANKIGTIFIFLILLLLSSTFFFLRQAGLVANIAALIALISPGIWLLMERGNYDGFIFVCVFISALLLHSRFKELGVLLIGATVLMKFYTLPLFILSMILLTRKNSKIVFGLFVLPLSTYTYYLIDKVADFPSERRFSFGLQFIGFYLQGFKVRIIGDAARFSDLQMMCMGMFYFILIFALLYFFKVLNFEDTGSAFFDSRAGYVYFGNSVVFLSCYFAGMNYDYRLIFLSILVGFAPSVMIRSRFRSILVVSGLVSLLFNTFSYGLTGHLRWLMELSGDFALSIFVPLQFFLLCKLLLTRARANS
jgi:hypothetical protein